jgi:acetylornithine deacetylase/succinyl-diaminopimelate desuccinylase-like protein
MSPKINQNTTKILQNLIQFDTTNPPGNEVNCIEYINNLLIDAGVETTILARSPNRPNLLARLKGHGHTSPLLLYGHVDVVTTENQIWKYPPFSGVLAEGYVWGRGALDMKGGVAMMISAILRAKAEEFIPSGDVLLLIVSDEENDCSFGSKYLVENHPEIFKDIRYAIGEFGGFPLYIGSKKFYPIQVLDKQICSMKAVIQSEKGGHGAIPMHDGVMAKLAEFLQSIEKNPLPVHITPVVHRMFKSMASELPFPKSFIVRQLLKPHFTSNILKLLGRSGKTFEPLFRNTINATIIRGGEASNVIPSRIEVYLDGRLLPGYEPQDMIDEIYQIIGDTAEIKLISFSPGPIEPDMGLFDTLGKILCELDADGIPIPLLLPAVTDARFLAQLGIQTYGFLPMNLPKNFNFLDTIHAANERIPEEALSFGTNAIYRLLQHFSG